MNIILAVIGLIVLILVIWFITVSNKIKTLKLKVEEAKSDIDVALATRYDIVVQSMNAVKGYIAHENEIMTNLVKIRKGMPIDEESKALAQQNDAIARVQAVLEAYPQLNSASLVKTLQEQLESTNLNLSAAKRCYNSNVNIYDAAIVVFPNSIVAGMTAATKIEMFKEENAAKLGDVTVSIQ